MNTWMRVNKLTIKMATFMSAWMIDSTHECITDRMNQPHQSIITAMNTQVHTCMRTCIHHCMHNHMIEQLHTWMNGYTNKHINNEHLNIAIHTNSNTWLPEYMNAAISHGFSKCMNQLIQINVYTRKYMNTHMIIQMIECI